MQQKPAQAIHFQLARASWAAPVIFMGANFVLRQSRTTGSLPVSTDVVLTALGALLALVGLVAGIVALSGIRHYGRKGILVQSLVGIALSGGFVLLITTNFVSAYQRAREPEAQLARAAERLQTGLPRMIDQDTELSRVSTAPGEIIYEYRLVNYNQGQLDPAKFGEAIAPAVTAGLCEQFASIPTAQFSFRVRYLTAESTPLTEILVGRGDCAP